MQIIFYILRARAGRWIWPSWRKCLGQRQACLSLPRQSLPRNERPSCLQVHSQWYKSLSNSQIYVICQGRLGTLSDNLLPAPNSAKSQMTLGWAICAAQAFNLPSSTALTGLRTFFVVGLKDWGWSAIRVGDISSFSVVKNFWHKSKYKQYFCIQHPHCSQFCVYPPWELGFFKKK